MKSAVRKIPTTKPFCPFLVMMFRLRMVYHISVSTSGVSLVIFSIFVTSSGKTRLLREQKEQALISRLTLCVASGQSLDVLSHMSNCRKHVSLFVYNLNNLYDYGKKLS